LIISEQLTINDVEKPMHGIINSEDYFDSVAFTINNCDPQTVTYSYGKEKRVIDKVEKSEGRIKFSVPLELGVENLLIYFDDEPALGYKMK
jgi:hypothetical protein